METIYTALIIIAVFMMIYIFAVGTIEVFFASNEKFNPGVGVGRAYNRDICDIGSGIASCDRTFIDSSPASVTPSESYIFAKNE
jgi:hypothetical protein